jgi:hypothetical protein
VGSGPVTDVRTSIEYLLTLAPGSVLGQALNLEREGC